MLKGGGRRGERKRRSLYDDEGGDENGRSLGKMT